MGKKKNFLAVYIGSPDSASAKKWDALDAKALAKREKQGIEAWMKWVNDHEQVIVDVGSPLGATLKADPNGVSKTRNQLTAYTIVEAESHEAAAKLFSNHPHFTIFPGDSVEIIECLPLPTHPSKADRAQSRS